MLNAVSQINRAGRWPLRFRAAQAGDGGALLALAEWCAVGRALPRDPGRGRALALDRPDGRVKVLAHKETDRVLGVHIVGPRAGDLIAEAVVRHFGG